WRQDLCVLVWRDLEPLGLLLARFDRTDDAGAQAAQYLILLEHRKIEHHHDAVAKERDDAVFSRPERQRSGRQDVGAFEPGSIDAISKQKRSHLSPCCG